VVEGRWRSWWWDGLLLLALALFTWLVAAGVLEGLDLAARDWSMTHDPRWARLIADVVNHLGQAWVLAYVLTVGLTLIALVRTRSWRVVLPGIAAFLLTNLGAGPLKLWTHRDAPSSVLSPDVSVRMFNEAAAGYAQSYPSGHIVNTLVWWPVIVVLLSVVLARPVPHAWRVFMLGWTPVIVFATTVYLSYHWVTDDIAAVLLGLFLARCFWRLPWSRLLP
jgi:PAP2 superfamily